MCFLFFFKQKTAYEMRISDWSSDVCSSDLNWGPRSRSRPSACPSMASPRLRGLRPRMPTATPAKSPRQELKNCSPAPSRATGPRSEEHTSEPQSLMRISYAVFCLKKKNTQNTNNIQTTQKDSMQIKQRQTHTQ